MASHWWLLALVTGLVISQSGCAFSLDSRGSYPDVEGLEKIVKGRSTKEDVTRLLGPPDEVIYSNREHDPLVERAFRYRLTLTRRTVFFMIIFGTYRSDTKSDHVMIFFDRGGVVEHIGSRMDSSQARYGWPSE